MQIYQYTVYPLSSLINLLERLLYSLLYSVLQSVFFLHVIFLYFLSLEPSFKFAHSCQYICWYIWYVFNTQHTYKSEMIFFDKICSELSSMPSFSDLCMSDWYFLFLHTVNVFHVSPLHNIYILFYFSHCTHLRTTLFSEL